MNKIIAVVAWGWLFSLTLLTCLLIRDVRQQKVDIYQLQRIVVKQTVLIYSNSDRITQLERPDEPVFPPRHPGRIGSIDSSDK